MKIDMNLAWEDICKKHLSISYILSKNPRHYHSDNPLSEVTKELKQKEKGAKENSVSF